MFITNCKYFSIISRWAARFGLVCLVAILASCVVSGLAYADDSEDEKALKAAYVMNFAKFAKWPDGVLSSDGIVNLCVLGDSSLRAPFQTIQGKKIGNRKLDVHIISTVDQITDCDMLFVTGERDEATLTRIWDKVKNKPVLTIGEMSHFDQRGGIINFIVKNGRICFEISPDNASEQGLALSSRLLLLAVIVDDLTTE